jgi:hypothetical protein
LVSLLLAGTLALLLQAPNAPPAPDPAPRAEGTVADAAFETQFRKFTPPDSEYSPFYSWDAFIGFRVSAVRRGPAALQFRGFIQAVGTQNFGSRVGVGGTGYLLEIGYVHRYSDEVTFSAGIAHLSSHLTRDLDEKTDEERRRGESIPRVRDPGEYNVPFIKARRRFASLRLAPDVEVAITPVNFRFGGGRHGGVRPVHVGTQATIWRRGRTSMLAETRHEIGANAFHSFAVLIDRESSSASGGRVQLIISATPGSGLHVSPIVGGVRGGVSVGARFAFPR